MEKLKDGFFTALLIVGLGFSCGAMGSEVEDELTEGVFFQSESRLNMDAEIRKQEEMLQKIVASLSRKNRQQQSLDDKMKLRLIRKSKQSVE